MIENENELSKLSESTIKLFKRIENRLLKNGLTVGLAYQLSDNTLMKKINFKGTERSFKALRSNIETIYKSGNYKVYINENGTWNTGEPIDSEWKEWLNKK